MQNTPCSSPSLTVQSLVGILARCSKAPGRIAACAAGVPHTMATRQLGEPPCCANNIQPQHPARHVQPHLLEVGKGVGGDVLGDRHVPLGRPHVLPQRQHVHVCGAARAICRRKCRAVERGAMQCFGVGRLASSTRRACAQPHRCGRSGRQSSKPHQANYNVAESICKATGRAPASRSSCMACSTSAGASPQPSMMEVLVTRAPAALAARSAAMDCAQLARLSRTTPCSRGTCAWRLAAAAQTQACLIQSLWCWTARVRACKRSKCSLVWDNTVQCPPRHNQAATSLRGRQ